MSRTAPQSSLHPIDSARFRTIFEQSPTSTQVFAPDGTTLAVNAAWERLWGVTLERIGPYNILQDQQLVEKGVMPYILRGFSGEATEIPVIRYEPDQTIPATGAVAYRWVRAFIYPVCNDEGEIREVVLMHEDITEETLARAEMERMTAEREATLGQIADGIVIVDRQGRVTFVNDAARRIHGVVRTGIGVDQYTAEYHLFTMDGDPYPPHDLPLARAVERRETVSNALWRIRPPGLPEVIAQGSATPVWGEDGSLLGAVLSVRDITKTYLMERQKDEFLSAMAHDLRTPLTTLRGRVQLLQRRLAKQTPETPEVHALHNGLSAIERSVVRMGVLINELLDVANSELGRASAMHRQEIDLVALVRQVAREQEEAVVGRHVRVEAGVPSLTCSVDPERLGRVFANLISNALKYSPVDTDVVLTIEQCGDNTARWARVAVADRGAGIPAEDLPHIFERFRRGTNILGRTPGMGIGLTVVRDIVEQHDGRIEVESREGEGSTFVVSLPLQPA